MCKRCAFQLQIYENRVEIIVILKCTSATVPRRFIEREKEEKIHILKVSRGNCELKAFTCIKYITFTSKAHILTPPHSILHLFLSSYEVSIQRMVVAFHGKAEGHKGFWQLRAKLQGNPAFSYRSGFHCYTAPLFL